MCQQCLFDHKSGFSFLCSGIAPVTGSNPLENTPDNDTRVLVEPSPHGTQNTTNLLITFADPTSTIIRTLLCSTDLMILHNGQRQDK
jgi:hypothetical protein